LSLCCKFGRADTSKRSPDGAKRNPGLLLRGGTAPHYASLHAGYGLGSLYRDNQRVATVGRRTCGFRQAELAADDVGPEHERNHLVEGMAPAHAFAAHAAVGADDEALGRDELQGAPDVLGHLFGPLDLQGVMVDDADRDLLVDDAFADRFEIDAAGAARFEGDHVGFAAVEIFD